jgi:hypothetical protein
MIYDFSRSSLAASLESLIAWFKSVVQSLKPSFCQQMTVFSASLYLYALQPFQQ